MNLNQYTFQSLVAKPPTSPAPSYELTLRGYPVNSLGTIESLRGIGETEISARRLVATLMKNGEVTWSVEFIADIDAFKDEMALSGLELTARTRPYGLEAADIEEKRLDSAAMAIFNGQECDHNQFSDEQRADIQERLTLLRQSYEDIPPAFNDFCDGEYSYSNQESNLNTRFCP